MIDTGYMLKIVLSLLIINKLINLERIRKIQIKIV